MTVSEMETGAEGENKSGLKPGCQTNSTNTPKDNSNDNRDKVDNLLELSTVKNSDSCRGDVANLTSNNIAAESRIPESQGEEKKTRPDKLHINTECTNVTEVPAGSMVSAVTPSSSYSHSVLECCKGCFIKAFVLCHWDNIVGPRISHVWKLSSDYEMTQKLLKTIATQTLNGEICRDPKDPNIDTKFFVLGDFGVAISAFVFGAADRDDLGVHSLTLLIPVEKKKVYFSLSDLCTHWTKRLVGKLKIFLQKVRIYTSCNF